MKKSTKIILSCLVAFLLIVIGFGVGFTVNIFIENKIESENLKSLQKQYLGNNAFVSGEISIHFLELGNSSSGDSIFIQCGDNDILVDAGSESSSASTIISYVDQFVDDGTLEYVFATHADSDHISAFFTTTTNKEGIFEHYKVENIIDFPKTNKNTKTLNNYISARDDEVAQGANHWTALECYKEERGAKRIIPLTNEIEIEILYNYYYENSSSKENNYSVCFMINQGDNHYLFTGDLESDGEEKLVNFYQANYGGLPQCVLYKAGHHGSKTSSSEILLSTIKPQYVCVCCCAGNSQYTPNVENQFPCQDMIDRIASYTDKVFVTTLFSEEKGFESMNGNIVFSVKKGEVTINCSNNNTPLKDTKWFKENRKCPSAWVA